MNISSAFDDTQAAEISVERISLRFRTYLDRSPQLKQAVLNALFSRQYNNRSEFWLYDDLSLHITSGERVGVIGGNGAGKTTLLKMLCGIYAPTYGVIRVRGRLSPVIELGAGFNPELSGAENILLNGAFLGFSRKEMLDKSARILEFAELTDSANMPIKYYSTGMLLRLAFSIATDVQPEILLLDEIFGAGDVRFASRARGRMEQLLDQSRIVVFVSHNLALVREMCTRVVWLHKGQIEMDGSPDEVCEAYLAAAAREVLSVTV